MPLGLQADAWLFAAGAAFVLTHLAVLVYIARRNIEPSRGSVGRPARSGVEVGTSSASDAAPVDDLPPVEGERVVECPHCAVQNLGEYRFCRYCVGELTGGATVSGSGGTSRDGQAF